jgi:hypothetical protein
MRLLRLFTAFRKVEADANTNERATIPSKYITLAGEIQ